MAATDPPGSASSRFGLTVAGLVLAVCWAAGCTGRGVDTPSPSVESTQRRPLRPLVYTEDPDHSPEAAAARERRLLRRLESGATTEDGRWGTLGEQTGADLPRLEGPEPLGRSLFNAIVKGNDAHWNHVFVAPAAYASLVHLDLREARKFVDRKQGGSADVREAFRVERPSESPAGGLETVFRFRSLELGEGRTLDGPVADDDEVVVQHWANKLKLGLEGEEATFVIRIPKILRLHPGGPKADEPSTLAVASSLQIGPRLEVFLEAGMHLKPQLLAPSDYPIPLAVGNYWRYRRRLAGDNGSDPADPAGDRPTPPPQSPLQATRVTSSVEAVDHYGTRRLVQVRHSYNDADLSHHNEFWLVTPRRIFVCPHGCRRHIEDLDWLLSYLGRQTPILRFPLSLNDRWDAGSGTPEDPQAATFRVADQWSTLEVPAGTFYGTLTVAGVGPLEGRLPFGALSDLRRFFAPGKGIVRRSYRHGGERIVETLVDYRIMPR